MRRFQSYKKLILLLIFMFAGISFNGCSETVVEQSEGINFIKSKEKVTYVDSIYPIKIPSIPFEATVVDKDEKNVYVDLDEKFSKYFEIQQRIPFKYKIENINIGDKVFLELKNIVVTKKGGYEYWNFDSINTYRREHNEVEWSKSFEVERFVNAIDQEHIKFYVVNIDGEQYAIPAYTVDKEYLTYDEKNNAIPKSERIGVGYSINIMTGEILCLPELIENNNEKYKEIGIIDFNFECVNAEYHRPKEQVPSDITLKKPVIYLYPENTQKINIKFADSTKLTHTYPKYNENDGWEVIASPDGKLVDKDNREYYCLYWEGLDNSNKEINEGFVVEGEDAAKFLEKKLKILGLTERETNEFIIYWLPILEENKYNLIKFRLNNELNKQVPLEITPKPDTLIRIAMDFKALDSKIEIPEQRLQKIQRKGYTVVEWGGRELK